MREGIELRSAGGAVSDAGVFVDVFDRGKDPQLIALDGTAERANIILARERLLGIGSGILNREARIERGGTLVESSGAMPLVGATFGGDHDGAGGGTSGIGIFLSGLKSEFLNGIRREVLQEAANPVIGIIAAIDGEFVVEAGTASSGDGGDACLSGIGRFDRFSTGNKVSDVGEAARGQREVFEIVTGDYALVNGAGEIDDLRGDGGRLRLNLDGLLHGRWRHGDGDVANCGDGDYDVGLRWGEAGGVYRDVIVAGR